MDGVRFDPDKQQWIASEAGGTILVRGTRFSKDIWESLSLAPPPEFTSNHPILSSDMVSGMAVCIKRTSWGTRNQYAYRLQTFPDYPVYRATPCHGSAKTIYVCYPAGEERSTTSLYLEVKDAVNEMDGNAETLKYSEVTFYPISDKWILQEIGQTEKLVSKKI